MTVLLAANPGGHVEELRLLAARCGVEPGAALWVTSRTPQTESLLAGQRVLWMPHVGSGDRWSAVRLVPEALRIQRRERPELVISTGAAAAVPHLLAAAINRCPVWYFESATRVDGPSATGRLAQHLPGATLFAQGQGWGDERWRTTPDVFDSFETVERPLVRESAPGKAVVSLGTERFPFVRALERTSALLDGWDVVWQTGSTPWQLDGVTLPQWVRADRLNQACVDADVVITHGGVGSALMALAAGKVPVIVPRRHLHGEHIDDHQVEFAHRLAARGLAVCAEPHELGEAHLRQAERLVARMRQDLVPQASEPGGVPQSLL